MLVSESKIKLSSEDVNRALAYYLSAEVFKQPVTSAKTCARFWP